MTALCVIPMNLEHGLIVAGHIFGGFVIFFIMGKIGERIMLRNELEQSQKNLEPLDQGHINYGAEVAERF